MPHLSIDEYIGKLRERVKDMSLVQLLRRHAAQVASCPEHGNVSGEEFSPFAAERVLSVLEDEIARRFTPGPPPPPTE